MLAEFHRLKAHFSYLDGGILIYISRIAAFQVIHQLVVGDAGSHAEKEAVLGPEYEETTEVLCAEKKKKKENNSRIRLEVINNGYCLYPMHSIDIHINR